MVGWRFMMLYVMVMTLSPMNGLRPVSISYSVIPKENRSVR